MSQYLWNSGFTFTTLHSVLSELFAGTLTLPHTVRSQLLSVSHPCIIPSFKPSTTWGQHKLASPASLSQVSEVVLTFSDKLERYRAVSMTNKACVLWSKVYWNPSRSCTTNVRSRAGRLRMPCQKKQPLVPFWDSKPTHWRSFWVEGAQSPHRR